MEYEFSAPLVNGTYIRCYVAHITGPDTQYRLKRKFMTRDCYGDLDGRRRYSVDIGSHGVFEVSIRHCCKLTDETLNRERYYIAYSFCELWEVDRKDVLETVAELKKRYTYPKKTLQTV